MKSLLTIFLILCFSGSPSNFLNEQKRFDRVAGAIKEKQNLIKEALEKKGLVLDNFHLMLVAYKEESELELYVKKRTETTYKKLAVYNICASSGSLGPKRKAGDGQVPEGFYYIDRFNPVSSYYLSLGVSYPNQSDKLKSKAKDLGGDIFIHGSCVTIGCMPMTNDKIKEIYLYAVHAKNNGQSKIPVYIFPFRMTDEKMKSIGSAYESKPELVNFWKNIRQGYNLLETTKEELKITVSSNGDYLFK